MFYKSINYSWNSNKNIYNTILHVACKLGYFDIAKYIISCDMISLKSQNIFKFCFFLMKLQIKVFFIVF